MWSVKMTIPGEQFFDTMQDVSSWLAQEGIDTSNFSYSRDAAGQVNFRISFLVLADAERFVQRFAGAALCADCPRG
jgi:hypothetical protein